MDKKPELEHPHSAQAQARIPSKLLEMAHKLKFVILAAATTYLTTLWSAARGQATPAVIQQAPQVLTLGPSSFAPPGAFPTAAYKSYFNDPTATSEQPQPVISDPALVRVL